MEDKNIVIVDETTIYEVDGACDEKKERRRHACNIEKGASH